MKTYQLIVMYPGMNSLRPTIKTDGFYPTDGGYWFYLDVAPEYVHAVQGQTPGATGSRRIICVYPIVSTIIASIEEIHEN
jgi:hypothetical protein